MSAPAIVIDLRDEGTKARNLEKEATMARKKRIQMDEALETIPTLAGCLSSLIPERPWPFDERPGPSPVGEPVKA